MIFCKEAVALLQAIASTIHQILTHHSKQEGGKYQKELEEIGEWLVADSTATEDYYKVPPRQYQSAGVGCMEFPFMQLFCRVTPGARVPQLGKLCSGIPIKFLKINS
ncbi:hypothetical protein AVEN_185831-1 [Araneus ventricosus]|uniref:Uncharacterized protein n=1 Tax=Araneus ventricosus TaxID=182803 RepID=A0A4Y2BRT0_ARAVE|nr:hypothetical protein AVEN_185831-1 [Araneus ventricosus]